MNTSQTVAAGWQLPQVKSAQAMDARMTIVQAIERVMRQRGEPMTPREVYEAIIGSALYKFNSDNPVHIVRSQIRRHCVGVDIAYAPGGKLFKIVGDGRYFLLDGTEEPRAARRRATVGSRDDNRYSLDTLKRHHDAYLSHVRIRILGELRKLAPKQFEAFCRNLLDTYGFRESQITRYSKDGGIDGFGRLKVGFDYFNVAFQCKRRTRGNIGRPDISQFRGDIQGQYEMGVFFTTARFTPEAKEYSLRRGAVPITLVDGPTIIEVMLEKGFGVEKNTLPVYDLALDLALVE